MDKLDLEFENKKVGVKLSDLIVENDLPFKYPEDKLSLEDLRRNYQGIKDPSGAGFKLLPLNEIEKILEAKRNELNSKDNNQ